MSNELHIINYPNSQEISEEEMTMATKDPHYGMVPEYLDEATGDLIEYETCSICGLYKPVFSTQHDIEGFCKGHKFTTKEELKETLAHLNYKFNLKIK